MTDIVDKATRSRMMAGIRGKDTNPELALRRALHHSGFRYRLHAKDVEGRPDLLLPKHRAVIFVHGCFWHRHQGCRFATMPATRPEFWQAKFEANIQRDKRVHRRLSEQGWRLGIVWECGLRGPSLIAQTSQIVGEWLLSEKHFLEVGA